MSKEQEFYNWLCDRYWKVHRDIEDVEHHRREIDERLRELRAILDHLKSLRELWLREQEMKAKEKK